MENLKKKFNFEELIKISHPLLGEDYVFEPEKLPSLKKFIIVHQTVDLIQTPLTLMREIVLTSIKTSSPNLRLKLNLCWNGYKDALDFLFNSILLFERKIPIDNVINISQIYEIGNFGLGWTWQEQKKEPDIIFFLRNNVVVSIEGRFKESIELNVAKEIDSELKKRKTTTDAYIEEISGLFSNVRKSIDEIQKIQSNGRLILGKNPTEENQLFFTTTSGSINRDPTNPNEWYYRASMKKGKQEITVFRIGNGILPRKEILSIEIV